MKRVPWLLLAAALGACSFSIGGSDELDSEAAAELVDEEFEEELGLGDLTTQCAVPNDLEEGDTFTCTSETPDGEVIEWAATATSSTDFDVESVNLINPEAVGALEIAALEALAEQGVPVGEGDLDCGDTARVLDAGTSVVCAITDQSDGSVYDATITITNPDPLRFDVQIADAPR